MLLLPPWMDRKPQFRRHRPASGKNGAPEGGPLPSLPIRYPLESRRRRRRRMVLMLLCLVVLPVRQEEDTHAPTERANHARKKTLQVGGGRERRTGRGRKRRRSLVRGKESARGAGEGG